MGGNGYDYRFCGTGGNGYDYRFCGILHLFLRCDEVAWDEQVQVSATWDETVTTGYKCPGCGSTK